jgi:Holliday junction resolvasome RuvABC endonuclease subunit
MSSTLRLAALDLSLESTGVAWTPGVADTRGWSVAVTTIRAGELGGHARLENILIRLAALGLAHADLVIIEQAIDNPRSPAANLKLAGLSWLVRHWLWRRDVPYALVPPMNRAKYATGNGRAKKPQVLAAVRTTYAAHVAHIDNDDEGDALAMLAMALHHYGEPLSPVPAKCSLALAGVAWPTLRRARPDLCVPDILTPGGCGVQIPAPVREHPKAIVP